MEVGLLRSPLNVSLFSIEDRRSHMMRQMGSRHPLLRFHPPRTLAAPDHHTRSRIIRTTPASSSSTCDPAPSRGWCLGFGV